MTDSPLPNRWRIRWNAGQTQDAAFLYGLSRNPHAGLNIPYDNYNQDGVPDENDAKEWKRAAKDLTVVQPNPLLGFALAIDHWQEPAMRAMEANKWKLVATGNRSHDRKVTRNGLTLDAYTRLYMKKFPTSGKEYTGAICKYGVLGSGSCAFATYDYEHGCSATVTDKIAAGPRNPLVPLIMYLHRVPLSKVGTLAYPADNFFCIAKTKFARYYVSNAIEHHIKEVK